MTRAQLKTDEPAAYRVVITRTPNGRASRFVRDRGELIHRLGPYGTLGAARACASRETAPYSWSAWDSVARVEVIRAETWEEVPAR